MCGLCGAFALDPEQPIDRAALEAMTRSLAHRGPDGERIAHGPGFALGFRRREVFAIYVLQSLIAACAGIALGMLLGYAAAAYFEQNPMFDWEGMVVRPLLEPSTFAVPALVVLAATAAAGGYAAWRAARVDPARALQSLE